MSFEEYWEEIIEINKLPNIVARQLPMSLSDKTKKKLTKICAEETIRLIKEVIEEINNGSVESVDFLINKKLEARQ